MTPSVSFAVFFGAPAHAYAHALRDTSPSSVLRAEG